MSWPLLGASPSELRASARPQGEAKSAFGQENWLIFFALKNSSNFSIFNPMILPILFYSRTERCSWKLACLPFVSLSALSLVISIAVITWQLFFKSILFGLDIFFFLELSRKNVETFKKNLDFCRRHNANKAKVQAGCGLWPTRTVPNYRFISQSQ